MVLQQIGVRKMLSHFDVEVEGESTLAAHRVEQPGDPLGVLVIGRDTRADQAIWRWQLLEDVDLNTALREQFVGGIRGRRPEPTIATVSGLRRDAPAGGSTGASFEVGGSFRRAAAVDRRPRSVRRTEAARGQLGVGHDRPDRTGADTRTAVDAGDRVDVEHPAVAKPGCPARGWMQFTGQGVDTGPVAATRLGDDVRHLVRSGRNGLARLLGDRRRRHQMLALRLAAEARRLTVDLADAPYQLGERVHQPGVVAEHPNVGEHVRQPLP